MSNLMQIHEPGETPLPHEDDVAVGIDLGTTHSVIALASNGKVEVLHDMCGGTLIPSVVAYNKNNTIEVGKNAKARQLEGNKDNNVITSIKRLMGRGQEDAQAIADTLPYELDASSDGMLRVKLNDRAITPVEISAEILKHLKQIAENALDKPVAKAVITVPAYFDDAARQATKDAATLAGLETLRLVNEPTAAALAYGLDNAAEGIYAIYDLGGGTFDISLLKLQKGVFQVLATAGDTALGGDDFDRALLDIALQKENSSNLGKDLQLAREAKEKLSTQESVDILETTITREMFERAVMPLIEKTIHICEAAMDDADVQPQDIQGVVLVGGSTRVPLVRKHVERLFEKPALTNVNPDEVVAVGAAFQAEGLTQGSDNLLLDVIPLSLGLETMGGLIEKIVHRNTPIPVSVSQEFTTYQDGQAAMKIHVLQGERELVEQNRSLATFSLTDIPPLPAGTARINVTFSVDADGLLAVSAEELMTGKKQTIEVKPTYGLQEGEIESMLRESMVHAREDITQRLLVEARVEAKRLIEEIKSAINASPKLVNEKEMHEIRKAQNALLEAIEGSDRDAMDYHVEQLSKVTQPFAERRMDSAISGALKGKHVEQVSGEEA